MSIDRGAESQLFLLLGLVADVLCLNRYETSTQSLTSAINEYMFANGRRYHAYYGIDKNVMPTDEIEQQRLDLHHESMLQMLKGELYKATLFEPHRILDVGTATRIWAIDMADKFPAAEVIGIDLRYQA
jgi:2-polyprenyl-3-methyl-5-hydroxy-6-metoxy-1,4-benzoquinol methylase